MTNEQETPVITQNQRSTGKTILINVISMLIAAIIIFGCWYGIRIYETESRRDIFTATYLPFAVKNLGKKAPTITQTTPDNLEELTSINFVIECGDYCYKNITVGFHFWTAKDSNSQRKYEWKFISYENISGDAKISYPLSLEELALYEGYSVSIMGYSLQ